MEDERLLQQPQRGPRPPGRHKRQRAPSLSSLNRKCYSTGLQLMLVFTLVLILFLTTMHTSVSNYIPVPRPPSPRQVDWLSNSIFNATSGIVKDRHSDRITAFQLKGDKFDKIRQKVFLEMEHYPYSNGGALVDEDENLRKMIMEEGGYPNRALVTTTWRSGSTFLGDILLAHPATYYHYEPLLHFLIQQVRESNPKLTREAVNVIKSLFRCDYSNLALGKWFDYARHHQEALSHNERLWGHCAQHRNRQDCFSPRFLSRYCSLFPFQSMKTVRLRMNITRQIIEDQSLKNVQVLLLVRDPRGTLQSRKHRVWCPGHPDCEDPNRLCSDLVDDFYSARRMMNDYPGRVMVMRYEDFCQDIEANARRVLKFFGLHFHNRVEAFIKSHTHANIGGVSSTFRDSKNAPYHWRQDLSFEEVSQIQDECGEAMRLWGYKQAETSEDLADLQPLMDFTL